MKNEVFCHFSDIQRKALEESLIACAYTRDEGEFFLEHKIIKAIFEYLRCPSPDFYFWFDRYFGQRPNMTLDNKEPFKTFTDKQITQIEASLTELGVTERELEVFSGNNFLEICLKCLRGEDGSLFAKLVLDHWGADLDPLLGKKYYCPSGNQYWSPATQLAHEGGFMFSSVDDSLSILQEKNDWRSCFHQSSGLIKLDRKITEMCELVDFPKSLKQWGDKLPEEKLQEAFPGRKLPNINFAFHLLRNKELIPEEWRKIGFLFLGSLFTSDFLEKMNKICHEGQPGSSRPLALRVGYKEQYIHYTDVIPNFGIVPGHYQDKKYAAKNWSCYWQMLFFRGIYQTQDKIILFKK